MDSADSPKPASNAKAWIIITAVVLMVTPFIVLALNNSAAAPASPATTGMVWIKGGEFTMGSDKADEKHAEEAPGHAVVIKGFWMDATEVTNAQFQSFVDATKYVTDAEKDLDPRQFPDAPPEMLKGGSLLFKLLFCINPVAGVVACAARPTSGPELVLGYM
jgi:formylglycine-generating enzyme required for sulfatase activity